MVKLLTSCKIKNNSLVRMKLGVFLICTLFIVMIFPKDVEAKAILSTDEIVEVQPSEMSSVTSVKVLRSEFQEWLNKLQ